MSQSAKLESALRQLELTYADFAGMTAEALRKHWRDVIKKSHPDLPENRNRAVDPAAVNAAFDMLKRHHAERLRLAKNDPRGTQPNSYTTRYERASIAPPWQPDKNAKNHRIYVESYRDENFIKNASGNSAKNPTKSIRSTPSAKARSKAGPASTAARPCSRKWPKPWSSGTPTEPI